MKYGLDYSYIKILVYKYYYLYTNIEISIPTGIIIKNFHSSMMSGNFSLMDIAVQFKKATKHCPCKIKNHPSKMGGFL